jgi:hypothetical protein
MNSSMGCLLPGVWWRHGIVEAHGNSHAFRSAHGFTRCIAHERDDVLESAFPTIVCSRSDYDCDSDMLIFLVIRQPRDQIGRSAASGSLARSDKTGFVAPLRFDSEVLSATLCLCCPFP